MQHYSTLIRPEREILMGFRGDIPHMTTVKAFFEASDFDEAYALHIAERLHTAGTYTGGGGAVPIWTVTLAPKWGDAA